MPALDFPDAPVADQEFQGTPDVVWIWDGIAWNRKIPALPIQPPIPPALSTPNISSIVPQQMVADGSVQTLRVLGSYFPDDSEVLLDNVGVPTTFVSETELTVEVTTPLANGTDIVKVYGTVPVESNEVTLTHAVPAPPSGPPQVSELIPPDCWINQVDIVVEVRGSNFHPTSQVTWNGTPVSTIFVAVNSMKFTANVAPGDPIGTYKVNAISPGFTTTAPDLDFIINW